MKKLPEQSSGNLVNGIWFVHEEDEVIVKIWLSTLTGKEEIYLNEELIAEKRNVTQFTTLHDFNYRDHHYDIEVFANNVFNASFECNIYRDGQLRKAYINRMGQNGNFVFEENPDIEATLARNLSRFRSKGIDKLKDFDVQEAITDLKKVLAIAPEDAETYYHLACAYSLSEEKEIGFDHLTKAITYGLKGKDRILTEDKLAFLRIQPEFEAFQQQHL